MNYEERFSELLRAINLERKFEEEELRLKNTTLSISERKALGILLFPLCTTDEENREGEGSILELQIPPKEEIGSSFQSGARVALFINREKGREEITGLVRSVRENKIKVLFFTDEFPEWVESDKLGLEILGNETTFQVMKIAIDNLIKSKDKALELVEMIYGERKPKNNDKVNINKENLNKSQNDALGRVLSLKDILCIQGPPGTGKTTTLAECIYEIIKLEKRTLLACSSNTSADLLGAMLLRKGVSVLRLGGYPVPDELAQHSFGGKFKSDPEYEDFEKCRENSKKLREKAFKFKRNFGAKERAERKNLLSESKELSRIARETETRMRNRILNSVELVFGTHVGIFKGLPEKYKFETIFIDEASQSLEPLAWASIQRAKKIVLAGDPFQLPPVVKSPEAIKLGFNKSILEIAIENQPESSILLDTQYRMDPDILEFSNVNFYNSKVITDPSVKKSIEPIFFLDTSGCDFTEEEVDKSFRNPGEADLLLKVLSGLVENLEVKKTLGVISPYSAQTRLLKNLLSTPEFSKLEIEVNTVDSFQGREMDWIFISLTRSNEDGEIGFLAEERRMNVAMTRAREKLVIIGDSSTLCHSSFFDKMVQFFQKKKFYRTAWEFLE